MTASPTASQIHEVRLRLRIADELAASADALRLAVERELIVHVVEELERVIHARFGDRVIIRVRRLAAGWKLDVDELASADVALRFARDLGDQMIADVMQLSRAERVRPSSEHLVVFDDERHEAAVVLADLASERGARWYHPPGVTPAAMWERIAAEDAIAVVIGWLDELEVRPAALAMAPAPLHAAIVAAVPGAAATLELARARARFSAPSAPVGSIAARDLTIVHDSAAVDDLDTRDGAAPVMAGSRPIAHAAALLDTSHEGSDPAAIATRAATAAGAAPAGRVEIANATPAVPALPEIVETLDEGGALETSVAGLFYLAGRVLEIELAERLWAAGLPEGIVLAAIADAILGEPTTAARWFGGCDGHAPAWPRVEAWAASEIVETVQHALGRRLARDGTACTPRELEATLVALAGELASAPDHDPLFDRVVRISAAALAMITCARLGCPPSWRAVRALCTRPGRLVLAADRLHVVMPHAAVDVDARRGGLDLDPGYVAWLRRSIHFEFAGGEAI